MVSLPMPVASEAGPRTARVEGGSSSRAKNLRTNAIHIWERMRQLRSLSGKQPPAATHGSYDKAGNYYFGDRSPAGKREGNLKWHEAIGRPRRWTANLEGSRRLPGDGSFAAVSLRRGDELGVGRDDATSYPNNVTLSMSRVCPKRTASDASAAPSSVSSSTSDSASAMLT